MTTGRRCIRCARILICGRNCRRSRASATSSARSKGEGVFQVPVGPVHAGIIEPGHFLFSVAGEPVLYLQLRLFYVHKGTEKLFENLPVPHCVRLAESISGDSSFCARDGLLPRRRAGRRRGSAAARPVFALDLPRTRAALQSHRRHRRDLHGRGLCHRQHALHAAQGARAARQRTAHRQPPVARHGVPRRRALRFRRGPAQGAFATGGRTAAGI